MKTGLLLILMAAIMTAGYLPALRQVLRHMLPVPPDLPARSAHPSSRRPAQGKNMSGIVWG